MNKYCPMCGTKKKNNWERIFDIAAYTFLIFIIGVILGYGWKTIHESKVITPPKEKIVWKCTTYWKGVKLYEIAQDGQYEIVQTGQFTGKMVSITHKKRR